LRKDKWDIATEISRRRKHLYEYSVCRNNFGNARRTAYRALTANRPPRNIASHAWPSAREAHGIKRGRNSERCCFGNRRVGSQFAAWAFRSETTERFRNQLSDLQNTHQWAKLEPIANGKGRGSDVDFASISVYSESCFNSASIAQAIVFDYTTTRIFFFFKHSHIEVRGAAYN